MAAGMMAPSRLVRFTSAADARSTRLAQTVWGIANLILQHIYTHNAATDGKTTSCTFCDKMS